MNKRVYIERIIDEGMKEYQKNLTIPRNCVMNKMDISTIIPIFDLCRNKHLIIYETMFAIPGCEIESIDDCISYINTLKFGDYYEFYKYNDFQYIICESDYDYYIIRLTWFSIFTITRLDKNQFESFSEFVEYAIENSFVGRNDNYKITYLTNGIKIKY